MGIITIHSASLEEIVFEHKNRWTGPIRISVEAPMLKQLTMSFYYARSDLGVSILAPIVEKVSWRCLYTRLMYGIGLWGLSEVGLNTSELTDSQEDGTCLQLPNVHVLSLHMCAQGFIYFSKCRELSFVEEMDKHMVTNFSSLDLHLTTKGHVFGAIVLYLLGLDRINRAIRNLKIVLLGPEVKDACVADCICDEPKDRGTQSIFLADLEKVEIEGVKGEYHELDFLKVIFTCAPMLRRVALELSDEATPSDDWRAKINDIVKAYPAVECTVALVPAKQF